MSQNAKATYDQQSECDQHNDTPKEGGNEDKQSWSERRNRKQTDGLEIGDTSITDYEFDEVFKQFQEHEAEEAESANNKSTENLEIYDYQMLYREGVECAYIAILQTEENPDKPPTIYAFREQELNADSADESKPTNVQNIFDNEAYEAYLEQGWKDITASENDFPWTIKSWLAMNMKQDTIQSR